jgi:SAM-dependent methyltransferase
MEQWEMVDEGWGRRAVEFATLAEPSNCREYVYLHERLGIGVGDRVLDVACGSGLAIELAAARGASCGGIDASPRLVAVARDRTPDADIRVGDMGSLPWAHETFDVVTSFRGIWGTTPSAVDEARRVLVPGGRLSFTCWGNVGKSPGAWMLAPFLWATETKIEHQADMVSLGFPGVGEAFLADRGFDVEERFEVPFCFEYADPELYARAIAASGPGYEAIQDIGEEEFHARAVELAGAHVRDGLPLRGRIELFGYIGTKR